MSITYNLNIPDGPNDPSADQPLMKVNTNAVDTWTNVDHIRFAAGAGNTAGTHKQVTFNNKNPAGAVTDPTSILYTDSGTASTNAEAFFRNASAIFPVSAIKAFVNFTVPATNIVFTQNNGFNISKLERTNNNVTVVVTLNTGCLNSNFATIFYAGLGQVTQAGNTITINGTTGGATNMLLVLEA